MYTFIIIYYINTSPTRGSRLNSSFKKRTRVPFITGLNRTRDVQKLIGYLKRTWKILVIFVKLSCVRVASHPCLARRVSLPRSLVFRRSTWHLNLTSFPEFSAGIDDANLGNFIVTLSQRKKSVTLNEDSKKRRKNSPQSKPCTYLYCLLEYGELPLQKIHFLSNQTHRHK